MAQEQVYKTSSGSLFFQQNGPNTEPVFLGCHDVGDIEEPLGEIELDFCRRPDGVGYDVVAERQGPPEVVTTTISGLARRTMDALYTARCPGALFVMRRCKGRQDRLLNYERVSILQRARPSKITEGEPVHHAEDNSIMDEFEIQAWPPVIRVTEVSTARRVTAETLALNTIWSNLDNVCAGNCVGSAVRLGDSMVIGADGGAGAGHVLYSNDGGLTWTQTAASPFAVGKHIMGITRINTSKNAYRLIAWMEGVTATQGMSAYSDDNGATWTTVNVGGATAGHGPVFGGGFYGRDFNFLVMAGFGGYIYKSRDGGVSWTAVDAGGVTTNPYQAIDFIDDLNGVAVSSAGVVAVTRDGGNTWAAATVVTGAPGLQSVAIVSPYVIWVGTSTGLLFYSNDFGVTWNPRIGWTGSGVGSVRAIDFVNDYVGFMISNTASPVGTVLRTIDGGYSWQTVTTPTNSGLNDVVAISENLAYVVGEANGGTGVIIAVSG